MYSVHKEIIEEKHLNIQQGNNYDRFQLSSVQTVEKQKRGGEEEERGLSTEGLKDDRNLQIHE